MRKRLLAVLLAVCLVAVMLPISTSATASEWSTAYKELIMSGRYVNGFDYDCLDTTVWGSVEKRVMLLDIDHDGIPELFIYNGNSSHLGRATYIYTYDDGEVIYIGNGPADPVYYPGTSIPGVSGDYIPEGNAGPHYVGYRWKDGNTIQSETVYSCDMYGNNVEQYTADNELFRVCRAGGKSLYQSGINLSELNSDNWEYFADNAIRATSPDVFASGYCGFYGNEKDATWTLDQSGELRINGTGKTGDYQSVVSAPWYPYRDRIKRVVVENGITHISDGAFPGYTQIESVYIAGSVKSMYQGVFAGCTSLTNLTLEEGVERANDAAFARCIRLTSVTLPKGFKFIANALFNKSTSLSSIFIPISVTGIGAGAFNDCTSLRNVYYEGTEAQWEKIDKDTYCNEPLTNATIHYNSTALGETETISLPFYSGIGNKDNKIPVAWSWDLFNKPAVTSNPYESYNNTLATTGLILSTAVEQSEGKCRSILLDKLKCTSYGYANYDSSSNLHPAVSLACKKLVVDGKEEYIFTVVVRGTSNGDDVWTDISSLWGGFDSAANNLYGQLGAFMGTTDLPDSDIPIGGDGRVKFFVTGHSLGGAMANIIAKKLSNVYGKENVFAYTFASPFVIDSSAESNTIGQGNIYNVLHKEDIVPLLPPNLSDRYGLSVWFSRKDFSGMYNNFYDLTNGKSLGGRLAPTNLSPLKGHDTEIYLSFLQTLSNGASLSQTNYAGGGGGGGAWCPVDLDIYMEISNEPTLVGRVRNNVIDESVTKNVVIRVKGDRKYFYFPYEGDYSIKLTGTDTDVMTFFIQDMDYSTGEPIEGTGKVFENVVLAPGKEMTAQVNVTNQTSSSTDTSNVKLYVLDAAGQPEKEVLPDGNGTEVPVTPSEAWSNPFHDVAEGAWYYEAVKFAHQNVLMSGTGANTFAPNTRLSRAMLAQVLYNKEGKPTDIDGKNFSDVAAGAWYANAVRWAASQGIAAGYGDGRFGPEDNITREQLATMLWRYAGSQQVADTPLDFRDAGKISSYAKTAMQWAVRDGIIGGKGNKTLDPKGYATRAEVAQMLKNYLSK